MRKRPVCQQKAAKLENCNLVTHQAEVTIDAGPSVWRTGQTHDSHCHQHGQGHLAVLLPIYCS